MQKKICIGNIKLNYMMSGEGETVLFINGLSADMTIWSLQLADLVKDHCIILFDNRGTGLSEKNGDHYSMKDLADDVSHLMEKMNIPSAHLVGHSMGGLIAQQVALRHPAKVKSLMLASTFLRAPKMGQLTFYLLPDILEQIGTEAYIDLVISQNYTHQYLETNYRRVTLMRRMLINHLSKTPIDTKVQRKLIHGILEHNTEDQANKIAVPTLVLVGAQDVIFPPYKSEALAEKIPNSQFEIIESCGHNLMQEQPEEFNRQIRSFISNNSRLNN